MSSTSSYVSEVSYTPMAPVVQSFEAVRVPAEVDTILLQTVSGDVVLIENEPATISGVVSAKLGDAVQTVQQKAVEAKILLAHEGEVIADALSSAATTVSHAAITAKDYTVAAASTAKDATLAAAHVAADRTMAAGVAAKDLTVQAGEQIAAGLSAAKDTVATTLHQASDVVVEKVEQGKQKLAYEGEILSSKATDLSIKTNESINAASATVSRRASEAKEVLVSTATEAKLSTQRGLEVAQEKLVEAKLATQRGLGLAQEKMIDAKNTAAATAHDAADFTQQKADEVATRAVTLKDMTEIRALNALDAANTKSDEVMRAANAKSDEVMRAAVLKKDQAITDAQRLLEKGKSREAQLADARTGQAF